MTQPTDEQIKEAMEWVDELEKHLSNSKKKPGWHSPWGEEALRSINVFRTALEFIRSEAGLFLMHKKNIDDVAAWRKTEEGRPSIPRTPRG